MFGSNVLDVAIGVVLVFLLVSIICIALKEGLESILRTRSANLEQGIKELLQDQALVEEVYKHPFVYSLFSGEYKSGGKNLPSYIPAQNFAVALMDIAARGVPQAGEPAVAVPLTLDGLRAGIGAVRSPALQRALSIAVDSAQGSLTNAQANLESWFNSSMDRVSGRYKRDSQWWLFALGLFVAVSMNINPIRIANYLGSSATLRQAVVAQAGLTTADSLKTDYATVKKQVEELHLPIGWDEGPDAMKIRPNGSGPWNDVIAAVVGWLLTALATTMGAPFWFDVLGKLMTIRSTVKPKQEAPVTAPSAKEKPAGG
ncbi:MAG: hypothetical protein ACOYON_14820 [Fimbriimonas sp.]